MLDFIKKLFQIYHRKMWLICALMIIVALFEGLIITLVVPLLGIFLGQTDGISNNLLIDKIVRLISGLLNFLSLDFTLGPLLLFLAVIFILQGIIRFWQIQRQLSLTRTFEFTLAHQLFKQYLDTGWPFFLKRKVGALTNVLTVEVERAASALDHTLKFLANLCITVFYGVISLLISWQLTIMGIIMGVIVSWCLRIFVTKGKKYGSATSESNNESQATAIDLLAAAKMIKATATQAPAVAKFDRLIKDKTRFRYLSQLYTSFIPSFYFPLVMALLMLVVYISVASFSLNFTAILIFIYIIYRLIPTLSSVQFSYHQAQIYLPGLHQVNQMIAETDQKRQAPGSVKITRPPRQIIFEKVSFGYEPPKLIINDVSLKINQGQTVAIAGSSGSGKTTLIDLLIGLLTPTAGNILVDGQPLTDLDLTSWQKQIGYLSQDVFLFHDTLRANLTWGKTTDIDETEIDQALEISGAKEFINEMAEGLDTIMGDRGVTLSGGQRQRLILARTILQKPSVIIFDEAFNAIDGFSTEKIRLALHEHFNRCIKIIISHQLTDLQAADQIYVIKNGRLELNQQASK